MLRRLRSIRKNQGGFILVEMIAVLGIMGLIGAGATLATIQMVQQGARNSDYTNASQHAMNAIFWISRDAQMAQNVTPDEGDSGFPLTLSWTEWDNSEHQVVYIIEDGKLKRSYSGGGQGQVVVAENINAVAENTTCKVTGEVLTLTVTATVGAESKAISVTRVREIIPRPSL